jgi:hypothetical protein
VRGDDSITIKGIVTIIVEDVNEAPILKPQSVHIKEEMNVGMLVGVPLEAEDQDFAQVDKIKYSIVDGNTGGSFGINENTGQVYVNRKLSYESRPLYEKHPDSIKVCVEATEPPLPYILNDKLHVSVPHDDVNNLVCLSGSAAIGTAGERTPLSSCPSGYSVSGIGSVTSNGYAAGMNIQEISCTDSGCEAVCPPSVSSVATCSIETKCCKIKSPLSCKNGEEAVTKFEGQWSPYSKCSSDLAVTGFASIRFVGGLSIFPRNVIIFRNRRCIGKRKLLGVYKNIQKCANACLDEASCKEVSFQSIGGNCYEEISGHKSCSLVDAPGYDLFSILSPHENEGYEAYECSNLGCRVKCFGTHCAIKARCCETPGELPLMCKSGSDGFSNPNPSSDKSSGCGSDYEAMSIGEISLPIQHDISMDILFARKSAANYLEVSLDDEGVYTEVTLTLWFQTAERSHQTMFSWSSNNEVDAFVLSLDSEGRLNAKGGGQRLLEYPLAPTNDGRWHHVCVSYKKDDQTSFIAVDGHVERTFLGTFSLSKSSGLTVGVRQRGHPKIQVPDAEKIVSDESFVGYISQVKVYSKKATMTFL